MWRRVRERVVKEGEVEEIQTRVGEMDGRIEDGVTKKESK